MDKLLELQEMIWHYQLLVNQSLDLLDEQEKNMKTLKLELEECFQGDIADALKVKMDESSKAVKKAKEDLDETLYLLKKDLYLIEG